MARPALLHVGMPKTGTTSLQMNLLVRHPGIQYLGKPLTVFNRQIAHLTRGITYDPHLNTHEGMADFEAQVVRPLTDQGSQALPLVVSEEEFSTSTPASTVSRDQIADRLLHLFPDARILITVRRQQDAIPSLFAHMQQMGLVDGVSFASWLDAWFSSALGSTVFDYRVVEQRFSSRFGADRVHLVPFELMRDDSEVFVDRVCTLMQADRSEGRRVWGTGDVRNARQGGPLCCTEQQKDQIRERYRDSNRALMRTHKLELGRWHYAV